MSKVGRVRAWIAGNRSAKKVLGFMLPEIGEMKVTGAFGVFVDMSDLTGPSYYLLHGGAAAFYHYEEAEKTEIIQGFPSDGVFIDIGANIGLFSLCVARLFPRASVYAFEPHPRLHRCLVETARAGRLERLDSIQACVSRQSGKAELLINRKDSGGHTLRGDQIRAQERQGSLTVEAVSLDAFVRDRKLQRIDAIKIDVQGAEWDVFLGGIESILSFKPRILVELDNRQASASDGVAAEILRKLEKAGYGFRRVSESHAISFAEFRDCANTALKRGELQTNYVFEALGA